MNNSFLQKNMDTKKITRWKFLTIFGSSVILIAAISIYFTFFASIFQIDKPVYVYIDTNDTADSIIVKVEHTGIPSSMKSFKWLMSNINKGAKLHTGRYILKPSDGSLRAFRRISKGQQSPIKFSINDIRTSGQLAKIIGNQLMIDSAEVATKLNDSIACAQVGLNKETIVCLFIPNTYEMYWNISTTDLYKKMKKEYDLFWNNERLNKAKAIGFTPAEVSTIASIVEEETNSKAERPMVAGLYINRLHKQMKLQADPTVKFALQDFTLKRITGTHLRSNSPYNTYKFTGLPPGPIRIPSINSVEAVLNYVKHDFVYMCAKEDFSGTHNFATTWEQHRENAKKYQNELNKRKIF